MASNESEIDIKLDYTLNTKQLIRIALTNKGAVVTDNTTFREYADIINNLVMEKDQSDSTALANDIVAGKIAYNNNNKVIGTLAEYNALNSSALEVIDDSLNNKLTAKIKTDVRTLLSKNANISIEVPYTSIESYNTALALLNDILGETDAETSYQLLSSVQGVSSTYNGVGGTTTEVINILNEI